MEEGGLAQQAGMLSGDHLISVNGTTVENWEEVRKNLYASGADEIELKLKRDGRSLVVAISMEALKKRKAIGWQYYIEPEVGKLSPGGPAEKAGLKSGDRLLTINGIAVNIWNDIPKLINDNPGKSIRIRYQRGDLIENVEITPVKNGSEQWIIGVGTPVVTVSKSLSESITQGTRQVFHAVKLTFGFLAQLVSGKASSDSVGGPIMIATMVGQAAQSSLTDLLSLVGFISLQLSIFNMLPVPALDGGHILFLLFEKIKGSALSKKFRVSSQKVGFIILITLILYISIQDGLKLLPV